MNIGIFCSANNNIDREYFRQTEQLARWCAENGHSIVFGGCNMGLMGCLAEAFKNSDFIAAYGKNKVRGTRCEVRGELIGVVPSIIEKGGRMSERLTKVIRCENLSDRKDLLLEHSDIIVALPGGIGTLDEVFTVAAAHTIGYHSKRVILFNIRGFWDSLIALLDDLEQRGMIRGTWQDYISIAQSLEELIAAI